MGSVRFQSGMSLIELMIAALLGLIMMAGLTQIFVSNKQTFSTSRALAQVQESGRMGAMILGREIRNADYWGCLTNVVNSEPENQDSHIESNLNPLTSNNGPLQSLVELKGVAITVNDTLDSHELTLSGIAPGGDTIRVTKVPSTPSANLKVSSTAGLEKGDILLISDCQAANIFQMTNVPDKGNDKVIIHNTKKGGLSPGNAVKKLNKRYEKSAGIYRPTSKRYYVDENANDERRLMVETTGDPAPDEVLANVEQMKVRLGLVDQNGNLDKWVNADDVTASRLADEGFLNTIQALEVSLLIRSDEENVVDGSLAYCFPGWGDCDSGGNASQTANDGHLWRSYTFTASLRNRIIEGGG